MDDAVGHRRRLVRPATLQLGGNGVDNPGNITVNAGTLRVAKSSIPDAVPLASVLSLGSSRDVKVEYAGGNISTLANNLNIDTVAAPAR